MKENADITRTSEALGSGPAIQDKLTRIIKISIP